MRGSRAINVRRLPWAVIGFLLAPLLNAQTNTPDIKVYFSPHGGCTEAVVNALHGARKQILVEAYSFTSEPIAVALIDAEKRGVDVEVILDKSQEQARGTEANLISLSGIPIYSDTAYRIAHDKVMVIDGSKVITGSFNFTKSAEDYNAETRDWRERVGLPKAALNIGEGRAAWARPSSKSSCDFQRSSPCGTIFRELEESPCSIKTIPPREEPSQTRISFEILGAAGDCELKTW